MESELLKDVDRLHEAFRIHVDADKENRSVLVLASDKEDGERKMVISCCGMASNVADDILQFLEEGENKSMADAVAEFFAKKDRTLKRMSMWVFFMSLAWMLFLVWFYFFFEYGDGDWIEFLGASICPGWAMGSAGYIAFR